MPIKDENLIVRSSTAGAMAMSVEENLVVADIEGTPLGGMGIFVDIGATTGGVPTLAVTIFADSTTAPTTASTQITAVTGLLASTQTIIPFNTHYRSICVNLDPGPSTTPGPCIVTAWLTDKNVTQPWTRTVEFH